MNDLDSPAALAKLSDVVTYLDQHALPQASQTEFKLFLEWLDEAFGLDLSKRLDLTNDQKSLLSERETARAKADFKTADKLRADLAAASILIEDKPFGLVWQRQR